MRKLSMATISSLYRRLLSSAVLVFVAIAVLAPTAVRAVVTVDASLSAGDIVLADASYPDGLTIINVGSQVITLERLTIGCPGLWVQGGQDLNGRLTLNHVTASCSAVTADTGVIFMNGGPMRGHVALNNCTVSADRAQASSSLLQIRKPAGRLTITGGRYTLSAETLTHRCIDLRNVRDTAVVTIDDVYARANVFGSNGGTGLRIDRGVAGANVTVNGGYFGALASNTDAFGIDVTSYPTGASLTLNNIDAVAVARIAPTALRAENSGCFLAVNGGSFAGTAGALNARAARFESFTGNATLRDASFVARSGQSGADAVSVSSSSGQVSIMNSTVVATAAAANAYGVHTSQLTGAAAVLTVEKCVVNASSPGSSRAVFLESTGTSASVKVLDSKLSSIRTAGSPIDHVALTGVYIGTVTDGASIAVEDSTVDVVGDRRSLGIVVNDAASRSSVSILRSTINVETVKDEGAGGIVYSDSATTLAVTNCDITTRSKKGESVGFFLFRRVGGSVTITHSNFDIFAAEASRDVSNTILYSGGVVALDDVAQTNADAITLTVAHCRFKSEVAGGEPLVFVRLPRQWNGFWSQVTIADVAVSAEYNHGRGFISSATAYTPASVSLGSYVLRCFRDITRGGNDVADHASIPGIRAWVWCVNAPTPAPPTPAPTPEPTPAPTPAPTPKPRTPTPTLSPTTYPTLTPVTATPTVPNTPSVTPSISRPPTMTPTSPKTRSATPSVTRQNTTTPSSSETLSPSATKSPMATSTPSFAATPSAPMTASHEPTASKPLSTTPSVPRTPSHTETPTHPVSTTRSMLHTQSSTIAATVTTTHAATPTSTGVVTPSVSLIQSTSPSLTPSIRPTPSATATTTKPGPTNITIARSLSLTGGTFFDITIFDAAGPSRFDGVTILGSLTVKNARHCQIALQNVEVTNVFIGNSSRSDGNVFGHETEIHVVDTTVSGQFDIGQMRGVRMLRIARSTIKGFTMTATSTTSYVRQLVFDSSTFEAGASTTSAGRPPNPLLTGAILLPTQVFGLALRVQSQVQITSCKNVGTAPFGIAITGSFGTSSATHVLFSNNDQIAVTVAHVGSSIIKNSIFTKTIAPRYVAPVIGIASLQWQRKAVFEGNTLSSSQVLVVDHDIREFSVLQSTLPLGIRWTDGRKFESISIVGCTFTRTTAPPPSTPFFPIGPDNGAVLVMPSNNGADMSNPNVTDKVSIKISKNKFTLSQNLTTAAEAKDFIFPISLSVDNVAVDTVDNSITVSDSLHPPAHMLHLTLARSAVDVRFTDIRVDTNKTATPLIFAASADSTIVNSVSVNAPNGLNSNGTAAATNTNSRLTARCVRNLLLGPGDDNTVTDGALVLGATAPAWASFDPSCPPRAT